MPKMEEQKITRQQLENARRTSTGVRGYFSAYCALHSCCDKCNRWVRLLCWVKLKIEDLQTAIILRICKEG